MAGDGDVERGTRVFRAGIGRRLPPGHIRIGVTSSLPDVLRDYQIDPDALFRAEGVSVDLFSHPDNALPFRIFCRLLARSRDAIGRDDIGLIICEKTGASDLGLVGFLLQQAADVRQALGDLVRYLHHHDRGAVPFMTVTDGVVMLGYSILEPDVLTTSEIYDGALAIGRNVMLGLCGPRWAPIEVTLSRPRPQSPARYERFFGAPVRFEAEQSAIVFSETWLDMPLARADESLRRMLQEQIDILEAEEAGNFAEQVRRVLRTALLTGLGSLEDVSELLRTPRRTLARHLEAEGVTFKQISEEVHFEIARQLLRNTSLKMTTISLTLNYSEPSAFTRAFRQWSGMSPREFRAQHVRESGGAPTAPNGHG
jgi:AraC-like DNA-binding protein